MVEELPKKFDLVVIGTGFPEACVAAAASRIEKSVLHIDPNEYYGASWASFNLEAFHALIENSAKGDNKDIKNGCHKWYIPQQDTNQFDDNGEITITASSTMSDTNADVNTYTCITKLMENSRKFNIDLCPKLLYSSGDLVQLLISSNICRYAEFRACDNIWTIHEQQLLNVPCSRSDVFNTKDLNIIEKRLLMKFLNKCLAYDLTDEMENEVNIKYQKKTFVEYLKDQQLTEKINHCIMQAISMTTEKTTFNEGMRRTKKFLQSLGRYGNTPFIFPMYGCGELPQCFCRLSAVFNGIYYLKAQITKFTVENNGKCVLIELDGRYIITSDHVVCSMSNLPQKFIRNDQPKNTLSRSIILTATAPLSYKGNQNEINNTGSCDGGVNLLRLVLPNSEREAFCIQLSHQSGTCPKGVYILHLTTTAISDEPFNDLQPFQEQIFKASNINCQILYAAYFTTIGFDDNFHLNSETTSCIFGTMGPSYALDYDEAIENSRNIFKKLYGDNVEFLPRAPDPEEIIIDGEDPQALTLNQLPEDLRIQFEELSVVTVTPEANIDMEENERELFDTVNATHAMEVE